jgi:deoxyribodipyrimidine photo-lyase
LIDEGRTPIPVYIHDEPDTDWQPGAASAWREFSHHLLYHFPSTPLESMDKRFNAFPWKSSYRDELHRWQRGKTGIPLVDAGIRELWTTGYMHNRARMIVASFLVKNLLIP